MIGASLNAPALDAVETGRRMASLFSPELRAVVVGGTSGIGLAVSTALAAAGVGVTATGISDAEIAGAVYPERIEPDRRVLNVAEDKAVTDLFAGLERVDIVVNCAGTSVGRRAEFDVATFQRVIDINLTGALRVANAAHARLKERGGAIVNFCSIYSQFGSSAFPAYAASKGGLLLLTRSLAAAWVQDGIRVNAVAPGVIMTPLTAPLMKNEAATAYMMQRVPLGRIGEPADVAGPVLFLCSPAAAYVTGALLPVDGGMTAV